MELYYPAYYHTFSCIAAACPDSCCKEWIVDVDPVSASYYRALPGDLGDRLRAVLKDADDGTVMEIENGRCPMWRDDGLCRIQAELGHDALCKTCRDFPRLRHDYGDFADLDLELSCPQAARLIFSADDSILMNSVSGSDTPDYDGEVMSILQQSRKNALELLRDSRYPLPRALAILLLYAHDVQGQIDGWEAARFVPEELLAEAKKYAADGDMDAIFAFFRELEILTDRWSSLLQQVPEMSPRMEGLSALARYLVRRYWLQAVSDLDLVCRVKFIITACLMVGALGEDPAQTAQLFSKEIENNPDNVNAILDGAYCSAALTDRNLLSILLG